MGNRQLSSKRKPAPESMDGNGTPAAGGGGVRGSKELTKQVKRVKSLDSNKPTKSSKRNSAKQPDSPSQPEDGRQQPEPEMTSKKSKSSTAKSKDPAAAKDGQQRAQETEKTTTTTWLSRSRSLSESMPRKNQPPPTNGGTPNSLSTTPDDHADGLSPSSRGLEVKIYRSYSDLNSESGKPHSSVRNYDPTADIRVYRRRTINMSAPALPSAALRSASLPRGFKSPAGMMADGGPGVAAGGGGGGGGIENADGRAGGRTPWDATYAGGGGGSRVSRHSSRSSVMVAAPGGSPPVISPGYRGLYSRCIR